ncbi:MAG: MDR family MFS transporter [Bordetella sp.]|uniref:MDR family MFS transporter n=1 Tax=Bordetella sp. TaxID=28081 RepID=UPI003F7C049C
MSAIPLPADAPRPFAKSLLAMLGICCVMMLVGLDQTVVGTALPTIIAELHGFDLYAWVATSYLLTSVITVPVFGRLGDYYGRKSFVVAAIIVFTLASVLCGLSTSMTFLVLARALQGVGGGMLVGTAFASVPDLFPDPRVRLRWQIMITSAFGLASAIGPTLGGVLTEQYGWRSVFYVNAPVGLLGVYFVAWHMPTIRHHKDAKIQLDWLGALLIALALGSLQLLVELLPGHKSSAMLPWLGAGSALAFAALFFWERRCTYSLLPFEMFRNRTISVLFLLAFLMGTASFSVMFYVPLMLQGGFGMSPQDAGLLVTPMMVGIPVASLINGRVIPRLKRPLIMLYIGFAALALSSLGVIVTQADTPHWLFGVYMALSGMGVGFVMPNLTIFGQLAAPPHHLGIATATTQSLRMVGGMIGTALVGTVVGHAYQSQMTFVLKTMAATDWLDRLRNPQVLLDQEGQKQVMAQLAAQGHNPQALFEGIHAVLVNAIHSSQYVGLGVSLLGLLLVRRVPPLKLKQRQHEPAEPIEPIEPAA